MNEQQREIKSTFMTHVNPSPFAWYRVWPDDPYPQLIHRETYEGYSEAARAEVHPLYAASPSQVQQTGNDALLRQAWTAVAERKPDTVRDVVIWYEDSRYLSAAYFSEGTWASGHGPIRAPSHWRELPPFDAALAAPVAPQPTMDAQMLTEEEITECYGHTPNDRLAINVQRAFARKNGIAIASAPSVAPTSNSAP